MATKVTMDLDYDASPDEVYKMLTDASFREEACKRMQVLRASATVEDAGTTTVVTIDQVQPARGLPSFATKLVGDEIQIVQQETWSDGREAAVHVSIPGKPGDMTGTIRLVEADGTTTETVDVEIKVNIPLVGGKIEGLIADMLRKALVAEQAVGNRYLSR